MVTVQAMHAMAFTITSSLYHVDIAVNCTICQLLIVTAGHSYAGKEFNDPVINATSKISRQQRDPICQTYMETKGNPPTVLQRGKRG